MEMSLTQGFVICLKDENFNSRGFFNF